MTSEEELSELLSELRVIQEYANRVQRAFNHLRLRAPVNPSDAVLVMHPETWNDILCNRHFLYYGSYGDGSKFVGLDVFRDTNLKPGELRLRSEVGA